MKVAFTVESSDPLAMLEKQGPQHIWYPSHPTNALLKHVRTLSFTIRFSSSCGKMLVITCLW